MAADALLRELNRQLEPEQQLAHLWILPWEDFPIGATGKTLKRRLRERYNAQLQASTTLPRVMHAQPFRYRIAAVLSGALLALSAGASGRRRRRGGRRPAAGA